MHNKSPQFLRYTKLYKENSNSKVFAPLADCYRKIGKFKEAEEILKKGLKIYPDYLLARIIYAQCLVEMDEYDRAGALLRPYLASNRDNLKLQRLYATIALQLNREEEALQAISYLNFLYPHDLEIKNKLKALQDYMALDSIENLSKTTPPPLFDMQNIALSDACDWSALSYADEEMAVEQSRDSIQESILDKEVAHVQDGLDQWVACQLQDSQAAASGSDVDLSNLDNLSEVEQSSWEEATINKMQVVENIADPVSDNSESKSLASEHDHRVEGDNQIFSADHLSKEMAKKEPVGEIALKQERVKDQLTETDQEDNLLSAERDSDDGDINPSDLIVTPTLINLYISQGFLQEAYVLLKDEIAKGRSEYSEKLKEVESALEGSSESYGRKKLMTIFDSKVKRENDPKYKILEDKYMLFLEKIRERAYQL